MNTKKWGKVVCFLLVELLLLFISIIIYRYRMNSFYEAPIEAGLKWAHKPNYEYILSAENDSVSEEIVLDFPNIQSITINGTSKDVASDAMVNVIVTHVESATVVADVSKLVSKAFDGDGKNLKISFSDNELTSGSYLVRIMLQNPGDTKVSLLSNIKPGIVTSFNNSEDKLNVITKVRYGSVQMISGLFVIITILVMFFAGIVFLWVDLCDIKTLFPLLMIVLGITFQIVIPVGGVPDESWHIDTAYKYSNMMMGIDDSANPGTIMKRKCDVIQSDMLGNNVETNSYYQLMTGAFKRADNTELMEVGFTDTSNQVFGVMYFPMALGMTIGRLFGLSAIMVYVLGRLFAFFACAALMYLAIVLMPVGKNITALIAILPISLQQGGSASYDSMLIGAGAVFAAMVLRALSDDHKAGWWETTLFALTGLLIVTSKGGVYTPVILAGTYFFFFRGRLSGLRFKGNVWFWLSLVGALIVLCSVVFLVYKDAIFSYAGASATGYGEESYSVPYIISNPGWFIQVIGNTIMQKFDEYFLGFMGGYLGWLSIDLGMVYAIPMFLIALLMANVEDDSLTGFKREKVILIITMCCSIFLVLLGMFLADTAFGSDTVSGVQGRYFLPFATFLFLNLGNHMVSVSDKDVKKLWKIGAFVEAVAVLQVIVYAWE
ncbi:DUF2142 domain-containing protein [Butyrivibrio sp. VCD2006]|uniref:DUF2142 domain-containing protein n=1 Tax=Butyrivibrio sp. VCD2006 TaxID=1280664 RepID=UPI00041D18B7|nr:DUF2142 domain-containing protein [Butyrivibrio sp. VCD2006]